MFFHLVIPTRKRSNTLKWTIKTCLHQNIDNFKDVYKLLNSLNISKKVSNYHELASSISFLRNQKIGLKIGKIGKIILKNTLKEIDTQIKNEFKKT